MKGLLIENIRQLKMDSFFNPGPFNLETFVAKFGPQERRPSARPSVILKSGVCFPLGVQVYPQGPKVFMLKKLASVSF
jgi:hypothetical protein